jgi:arylsulfate sulfotransferase
MITSLSSRRLVSCLDQHLARIRAISACASVAIALVACGGDDATIADRGVVASTGTTPGPTPFIASIGLDGAQLDLATRIGFTIAPAPGSASKPVSVSYSRRYLEQRGYARAGASAVTIPVFGLYANRANAVSLEVFYPDGSSKTLALTVTSPAWDDTTGIYSHPVVVTARAPNQAIGFDFLFLKSSYETVVLDTDGQVRWVSDGAPGGLSSIFTENGFEIGALNSRQLYRLDFDGSVDKSAALADDDAIRFHHDIEAGKTGLLGELDMTIDGQLQLESTLTEFAPSTGSVIAQWDMGQILSNYMRANGDDPSTFVRPGIDWFHMNTAIYDPSDDSVIVSSRENFVIKLDYSTKAIRWIIGDPQKYWFTFPSLRAVSLTLSGDGLVPIGQHGVNIAPDGSLLLFNNGTASVNQPAGEPAGEARSYSAVSDYRIDESRRTYTEVWHYDHDQTYLAPFCSSVRQQQDGSMLIDYATAGNLTQTHLVGTDPSRKVVFDYQFPNANCDTGWNAMPLPLDAMKFE